MTPRRIARVRTIGWSLAALAAFTGCATTVDETSSSPLPTTAFGADDVAAPTESDPTESGPPADGAPSLVPVTVAGTATVLLPELAIEMSRLGSQIADGEGDDATLARIEEIWTAIRPEIEATHPELVAGIEATLDMARVAVERTRPADADKAFSVLTDLVDRFTGDG